MTELVRAAALDDGAGAGRGPGNEGGVDSDRLGGRHKVDLARPHEAVGTLRFVRRAVHNRGHPVGHVTRLRSPPTSSRRSCTVTSPDVGPGADDIEALLPSRTSGAGSLGRMPETVTRDRRGWFGSADMTAARSESTERVGRDDARGLRLGQGVGLVAAKGQAHEWQVGERPGGEGDGGEPVVALRVELHRVGGDIGQQRAE